MSVVLNWNNTVAGAESVVVYRSTSAFTPAALPAALTTLAGDAVTYIDTTAALGTTYYYTVEIKKGTYSAFSPCVARSNLNVYGPGSSSLIRGDWSCGLMDFLTPLEFCDSTQLLGLLGASGVSVYAEVDEWVKVIYFGKVLFIPNKTIFTGAWRSMYDAGAVCRTDTTGGYPAGSNPATTPVVQNKRVSIGGYSFKVGLPNAGSNAAYQTTTTPFTTAGTQAAPNEVADVLRKFPSNGFYNWSTAYVQTQLQATATNALRLDITGASAATPTIAVTQQGVTGSTNYLLPILELDV